MKKLSLFVIGLLLTATVYASPIPAGQAVVNTMSINGVSVKVVTILTAQKQPNGQSRVVSQAFTADDLNNIKTSAQAQNDGIQKQVSDLLALLNA